MPMVFRLPSSALLFALTLLTVQTHAAQPRFAAIFKNGDKVESERISDWHSREAKPRINGRLLFDAANPVRTIRDRSLTPGHTPDAFVEMHTGDRLPGTVESFASGEVGYAPVGSHFVVKPGFELRPPRTVVEPRIRVLTDYVRRVVWQRTGNNEYQPGRIFYRDGRSGDFRAARFNASSVTLLSTEGVTRAFYAEIAELHLPQDAGSAWDYWFDELAVLSPAGDDLLFQWDTTHGARITSSLARFTATVKGNPADIDRWVHAAQPAWSLDIIWIASGEIWQRMVFAVNEASLLRVAPAVSAAKAFGGVRNWRQHQNVLGGPLTGNGETFAWGAGVHGATALQFPLPGCATSFQAEANLDDTTGNGGCVRLRVLAGPAGKGGDGSSSDPKVLYTSGFITGSSENAKTGSLQLAGAATLSLEVDQAHQGRPAGADPLNIRDRLNWLEPLLVLDLEKVKQQIQQRVSNLLPAWNQWSVQPLADDAKLNWDQLYNKEHDGLGEFELVVAAQGQPLVLQRNVHLAADKSSRFLMLAVAATRHGGKPTKLEVRIDGEAIGEYEVPLRSRRNPMPPPIAIKLEDFAGNDVQIEIVQLAIGDSAYVDWSAARFSPHLPTLIPLLEDEQKYVSTKDAGDQPAGTAALIEDDQHSGQRCLKLTPAGGFHYKLAEPLRVRAEPGWGEFRHLRFAFRKFGKGRISLELTGQTVRGEPMRYDAGIGEPVKGQARRVWVQALPAEWIVMTRDLWAEFGDAEITGITLSAVDGEYALFDHIYLGRSTADFEKIAANTTPETANRNARRELVQHILDKVLPATVAYTTEDGRTGTGVIVNDEGDILTAGHIVVAAGKNVKVHLQDGRTLEGKTRGVFRELDLGMISVQAGKPLPFAAISRQEDIGAGGLFVGASYPASYVEKAKPVTYINGVRRAFRQLIWGSYQTQDYSTGAPLFDEHGHVVGIHFRTSRFGGFMYTRLNSADREIKKMKKGEVWGKWPPASAPVLGVKIESIREGAKITAVAEKSAAADAGVKAGDIFNRVDNRSVVSLDDIYETLADNNVGDTVQVELTREGKKQTLSLKLAPRTP